MEAELKLVLFKKLEERLKICELLSAEIFCGLYFYIDDDLLFGLGGCMFKLC